MEHICQIVKNCKDSESPQMVQKIEQVVEMENSIVFINGPVSS